MSVKNDLIVKKLESFSKNWILCFYLSFIGFPMIFKGFRHSGQYKILGDPLKIIGNPIKL